MTRTALIPGYVRLLLWVVGFAVTTAAGTLICVRFVPAEKCCPDFVQFYTAARLLGSGESPYDSEHQASVQRELGWDKDQQGLGIYDFMPYYYPPWLGLACLIFLPLSYSTAKIAWLVINIEFLILSGYQLGGLVKGVPRWVAMVVVCCFAFPLFSLLIGQISPLLLFLIVTVWCLLEQGRDYLAGATLALVLTKPQIGLFVAVALLLWATCQRRRRALMGCLVCLLALCLVSFALVPTWPWQMLTALRVTPLVTQDSPWLSVTWSAVLETIGVSRFGFWPAYLIVVGPCVVLLLRTTWDGESIPGDVTAWAILAAFLATPYARLYDLTVLTIPLLLLLPGRMERAGTVALLLGCMVVPFVQLYWVRLSNPYRCEVSFFWLPALLALVWWTRGPVRLSTVNNK